MTKHVRADSLSGQRRDAVGGFRRATLDHLANAGAGDRALESVQEYGLVGGTSVNQICTWVATPVGRSTPPQSGQAGGRGT